LDVQVDGELIRLEREKRAWSQEHLAGAAGIGARTVQRIEATGIASYESARAISAALEVPVAILRTDKPKLPPPSVAPASQPRRRPILRTASTLHWIGAASVFVVFAAASGFLLLEDYQKVRVLRTVEHWVTSGPETAENSR
jgi:transcriptional regulator with XRE-family HTH domain